ncbi:hypothetical protein NEIG_01354 [Nematocida sp. ERTm5]|nr:hypothetical protein NEIG_01354 [Nematocida sp. ERTm5]
MKIGMIIKLLLMMYAVYARIELVDIKKIGEIVVIQEDRLLIHPNGPLSPLRGYIMHRSGYMFNKRFYSSEIDTDYILTKTDKVIYGSVPIYDYIRQPINDQVYDDIEENKEYLTEFHTLLIGMFPSPDGSFSIVSGRKDAMYPFLIKDEVQAQSMHILAALFLLSEDVNIPINTCIQEEKILFLESTDGITTYINLKNPNNYLVNLIEFLKKYIDDDNANPNSIESMPNEPTTYEQFKTGEFLNTKQFLVQSYIYEFIDTPEKYIKFVEAVHTLLNDQIKNEKSTPENKAKSNKLLEECFIEENTISGLINHAALIFNLKDIKDKCRKCPFIDTLELPIYTRVKAYDRTNDKELNDEDKKHSNYVEASLLGLACCLMYDPNTRKYTTEHLPDNEETKPLKKFFEKYPVPTEITTYEMQQDWYRVVADLKNDKIFYIKEGNNELETGLLNMLYVISDITGNNEEVLEEIESIKKRRNDDNHSCIGFNIEENLITIFTALSTNKDLEVDCGDFKIEDNRHSVSDLFGSFDLLYNFNELQAGISVDISKDHVKLSMEEDSFSDEEKSIIIEEFTKVQNMYSNPNNYTECIIKHYIYVELAKIQCEYVYVEEPIESILLNSISKGGYISTLNIFLYGRIELDYYKVSIITNFLMFYANPIIKDDSSLVRMTNNLIGNLPLDSLCTRDWILRGYIYNSKAKDYYKKIDERAWDGFYITNTMLKSLYIDLFLCTVTVEDGFTHSFAGIMKKLNKNSYYYYKTIQDKCIIEYILDYLDNTSKPKFDTFCTIINIVNQTLTNFNKQELTNIHLSWFFDMFSKMTTNTPEIRQYLLYLFSIINDDYITTANKEDIRWSIQNSPNNILNFLQENSNMICGTNLEISNKINKIVQLVKDSTSQEQAQ